jgi:hypothetical protein
MGHQKVKSRLGGLEPASRIQTRSELESDFMSPDSDRGLSDAFERREAGPTRRVQPFQACRYQDAIFPGEWNDVRNGAERDEIQKWPEIVIGSAGEIGFTSAFHNCVSEFERKAD